MKILSLLKSLPIQLSICLIFAVLCGDLLPVNLIRSSYTLSVNFKELLICFLPVVIFTYVTNAVLQLDKRAPYLISVVVIMVVLSNALAVNTSFLVTKAVLPMLSLKAETISFDLQQLIQPYFTLHIPKIAGSDKIMFVAILFGLTFSYFKQPLVNRVLSKLYRAITLILLKGFIPILPLYILGFALKMKYEGNLSIILGQYVSVFTLIVLLITAYMILMYLISSGFKLKEALNSFKTMLPAGVTGLTTMSSLVTMPISLSCAQKNLKDESLTNLMIPTTASIHMLGDVLSIPALTFGVMYLFGQPMPTFQQFLLFVPAFCMAKFSLAAIPGGAIIVILPILQSYFDVSPEAASLITTIYILQDPICTFGNVMMNGAFALICQKVLRLFNLQFKSPDMQS